MRKIKLKIILPSMVLVDKSVNMVTIPTYDGMLGIMCDHMKLIVGLSNGLITVKCDDKTDIYYLQEGIANISGEEIHILGARIVDIKKISSRSIQDTIQKYEKQLKENEHSSDYCEMSAQEIQYNKNLLHCYNEHSNKSNLST